MSILAEILAHKREELAGKKAAMGVDELRRLAESRQPQPEFASALRSAPIGLIAEVKRRSPSSGTIREPFLPEEIAGAYERAGAQAISVLLDEKYFGGGADLFQQVRAATNLPLLYKEFVVEEWQVWHAAALGASAVLLIAAGLQPPELEQLVDMAENAGLEVLCEVHNAEEMAIACQLGAVLIGINNRDLATFEVSLETTLDLMSLAPANTTLVSESGIKTRADVERLQEAGVDGILVGQQLLEGGKDPAAEIARLMP